MTDIEEIFAEYDERGDRQAMLGLADVDGVLRGKFVSLAKLRSLFAKGGGFCDCVLGWDMDDQLYDGDDGAITGWHSGFPDARYRLIAASRRRLPDVGTPYFVAEFADSATADGDHPLCPRSLLRRVLDRAAAVGLTAKAGFEYELFVFRESPHSVRNKNYRNLDSFTPGNFGYSVLRAASNADFFTALMNYCDDFRMPLEGLHCETGPGVWEAALQAAAGLEAADRAILFKTFCKSFFRKYDAMPTFMAKWSMDYPGQSGHYHFSLLDENGDNVFAGQAGDGGVPDRARWALGGLVHYTPELLAMLAPTVNSFTRLVRGAWAPTASTWGVDNRTTALRLVPGSASDPDGQHIECRVGGADGNPYLVSAATLGAALAGIERKIEPPEAVVGNAYDIEEGLPRERQFAPTLRAAAQRFNASHLARELFGAGFVEHYAETRLWESRQYERHVNDWQLARYFEIV